MSNCGPPVHLTPVFRIPPGAGGSSTECLITNNPILKLDFFFAAPPSAPDTSCLSGLFAVCDVSENLGITHVAFSAGTGPGIAASEVFDVAFTGFPDGKVITQAANSPEPDSFPILLMALAVWALYGFCLPRAADRLAIGRQDAQAGKVGLTLYLPDFEAFSQSEAEIAKRRSPVAG